MTACDDVLQKDKVMQRASVPDFSVSTLLAMVNGWWCVQKLFSWPSAPQESKAARAKTRNPLLGLALRTAEAISALAENLYPPS